MVAYVCAKYMMHPHTTGNAASFADNRLDGLSHLYHTYPDISFAQKQMKHGRVRPQNTYTSTAFLLI